MSNSSDSAGGNSDRADRNLLFGVLALRLGFMDREQLAEAMENWSHSSARSMADWLVERQILTTQQVEQVHQQMITELAAHQDSVDDSLHALRESGLDWDDAPPSAGTTSHRSPLAGASSHPDHLSGADRDTDAGDSNHQRRDDPADQVDDANLETRIDSDALHSLANFPIDPALATEAQRHLHSEFEIRRKLGQGGQGVVLLAHDRRLQRDVAIKQLRANLAEDTELQQRLIQEAEIISGLEHPGIVPVYGVGHFQKDQPFYAMRLIEGTTLANAVKQELRVGFVEPTKGGGSLPQVDYEKYLRKYLQHFIAACNAVAYAHSRGVVHRDLKPANIMLGQFGETLVVDWGLAKAGSDTRVAQASDTPRPKLQPKSGSSIDPTMEGGYVGTPAYMSPEQASGKVSRIGIATDVFGLGATLYYLLTGAPPYEGVNERAIRALATKGSYKPARQVSARVPRGLSAICDRAMQVDPAKRYADAADLRSDVEQWLGDEPLAAAPDNVLDKTLRWTRRHRGILFTGIIALSLLTMVSLAANYLLQRQKQQTLANLERAREMTLRVTSLVKVMPIDFNDSPAAIEERKKATTEAVKAVDYLLEFYPNDFELNSNAMLLLRNQAMGIRFEGQLQTAETQLQRALKIYDSIQVAIDESPKVAGTDTTQTVVVTDGQEDLELQYVHTLRLHSLVQLDLGRTRDAVESLTKCIQILDTRKKRHRDPGTSVVRESKQAGNSNLATDGNLGDLLQTRGGLRLSLGDHVGGREDLEAAEKILDELVVTEESGAHSTVKIRNKTVLASTRWQLAGLEKQEQNTEKALELYESSAIMADELKELSEWDYQYLRAIIRLAQARFWLENNMKRTESLGNLEESLKAWKFLTAEPFAFLHYQIGYAEAQCALAEQRMLDPETRTEAAELLHKSRSTLNNQIRKSPEFANLYFLQSHTLFALSRLEQLDNHPEAAATYHQQATEMSNIACEKSAENISYREWHEELNKLKP